MVGAVVTAVIFAVALVAVVIMAVRALRPRESTIRYRVQAVASTSGLAVTEAVEAEVVRRVRRDYAGDRIGYAAGVLIAFAVILVALPSFGSQWEIYLAWLPLVLIGSSTGSAVVAITTAVSRPPDPRIARSRAVGLNDYVHPIERWGARTLPLVVLSGCAAAIALDPRQAALLGPAVLAALATAAMICFETVGRFIVGRPQAAATTTELAWDDALRAIGVRSLADSAIGTALYAGWLLSFTIAGRAQLILLAAAIVVCVAVLIGKSFWTPQRHFLRRLWPRTAAAADVNARAVA